MSGRVPPEMLRALRNELGIDSVIFALEIPWRRDDMKLRFICPQCHELDTSVHSKENLGRCFSCRRNFNSIDLVMAKKEYPFRRAVDWLMAVRSLLETDDGQVLLSRQSLRTRMR